MKIKETYIPTQSASSAIPSNANNLNFTGADDNIGFSNDMNIGSTAASNKPDLDFT